MLLPPVKQRARFGIGIQKWFLPALTALAAGSWSPGHGARADEEADAKAMAAKKKHSDQAGAHHEEKAEPEEGAAPDLHNGHGRGSHPGEPAGQDPGASEGHGDTHDLAEHGDEAPLKLQRNVAPDDHAHHEASAEETAMPPHQESTKPLWENGILWFGIVAAILVTALFVFI